MDTEFLQERIAKAKIRIVALEDALLSLSSGKVSSYTLDTGQTREVVTKKNISTLERTINAEYNLLVTLQARLNGGGVQVRPGW